MNDMTKPINAPKRTPPTVPPAIAPMAVLQCTDARLVDMAFCEPVTVGACVTVDVA